MHCFSASYEIAKECIDLGLFIAFGGALTFKNAVNQWAIASKLPQDRLLIETDCPYMTPVPFRGRRNDPTRIALTLKKLSELRETDAETLSGVLLENSFRAFASPLPSLGSAPPCSKPDSKLTPCSGPLVNGSSRYLGRKGPEAGTQAPMSENKLLLLPGHELEYVNFPGFVSPPVKRGSYKGHRGGLRTKQGPTRRRPDTS